MMRDDRGLIYDPEDILIALPPVPAKAAPARPVAPPSVTDAADAEILARLRRMRGGAWGRLYDTGDLAEYGDDWSAADQGLVNGLVAACDGDTTRADHFFRQSALWREKWDERHYADGRTYGQGTLDKALAWYQTTPQTYKPDPIVTINTPPADASTAPCADTIAAMQARIDQLEAALADANDRLRASLALDRNAAIKPQRTTVRAVAWELTSAYAGNRADPDGWVKTWNPALAENAGISTGTLIRNIDTMAHDHLIEKKTVYEPATRVDRDTGEVIVDYAIPPKPRVYLRCQNVAAMLTAAAAWTPSPSAKRPHAASWGGFRESDPATCPHTNTQTVCLDCGAELFSPDSQDATQGDETTPAPNAPDVGSTYQSQDATQGSTIAGTPTPPPDPATAAGPDMQDATQGQAAPCPECGQRPRLFGGKRCGPCASARAPAGGG